MKPISAPQITIICFCDLQAPQEGQNMITSGKNRIQFLKSYMWYVGSDLLSGPESISDIKNVILGISYKSSESSKSKMNLAKIQTWRVDGMKIWLPIFQIPIIFSCLKLDNLSLSLCSLLACTVAYIPSSRIVFPRPVELRRWDSIEPILVRLEACIPECFHPQKATNSFFKVERVKSD